MVDIDLLQDVQLLDELGDDEMARVAASAETQRFLRGDVVFARGLAKVRLGQDKAAKPDLAAAAAWAKGSANRLNSLCWGKATSGILLAEALADCDASLAIEPASAATLDSKGLVLLRLDRAGFQATDVEQRVEQARSAFDRLLLVPEVLLK